MSDTFVNIGVWFATNFEWLNKPILIILKIGFTKFVVYLLVFLLIISNLFPNCLSFWSPPRFKGLMFNLYTVLSLTINQHNWWYSKKISFISTSSHICLLLYILLQIWFHKMLKHFSTYFDCYFPSFTHSLRRV